MKWVKAYSEGEYAGAISMGLVSVMVLMSPILVRERRLGWCMIGMAIASAAKTWFKHHESVRLAFIAQMLLWLAGVIAIIAVFQLCLKLVQERLAG